MVRLFRKKKSTEEVEVKKNEQLMSLKFLAKIQPQGGVSFKDKYIQKGDGYEACIHVWQYPTIVNQLWLAHVMSMSDVTVVKDVSTMDKNEVVAAIDKSIVEHEVRFRSSKDESKRSDAESSYQEMKSLYDQISKMGEVVKVIHVRLYVHDPDKDELEKKINAVQTELTSHSIRGQVFLNESEWEWKSMFLNYDEQQKLPNAREGKGMPALTLGASLPYNYSYLDDDNGSYLGQSSTGGNVLFDLFYRDRKRRFYNGVVVGKMGAGKSTLLKKLAFDNASRGNFIRGFDVTGEFTTLVKELKGHSIALDGSQGVINPLQIFRTVDNSNEKEYNPVTDHLKDEQLSFMQHISKVTTFYQYLSEDYTGEEIEEFKRVLRMFYEIYGFTSESKDVTTRPSSEYPIFSDFFSFLQKMLYEDVEKEIIREELSHGRTKRLEKIMLVIENLVKTYSHLFNGHTTIPDFTNEQIIFFSIRNLTSLEKRIFNAQMFNALNMIWDNLIQIGSPQMKRIYEDKDFQEEDVKRLLVLIDEAHRMVNADNMLAVSFLTDFAREARKYFGGLLLASQSIRDFVPEHADTETVSKIRTLFELTQYKFIMQQDVNTIEALAKIFENEMSVSELEQIPQFEQGDCLLSISGVQNIVLEIEASQEELALFTGGL